MKDAYFAGGCFWCMAKPYTEVNGVVSVESGYCGGAEEAPSYEAVKKQLTGHRETVRIVYDPTVLSFEELLYVYFYNIDPFDAGGQFIDRGYSYTCAVYYTDGEQREITSSVITKTEREFGRKVFVSVEPFERFWLAEEYHQSYAQKNPEAYEAEHIASGRAAVRDSDRVDIRAFDTTI